MKGPHLVLSSSVLLAMPLIAQASQGEAAHGLFLFGAQIPSLVIVLAAACAASFASEGAQRLGISIVVLELLFGFVIGPAGLGWAAVEGLLPTLASVGMGFVFFLAGFEIELEKIRGAPARLGMTAWLLTAALSAALAFAGHLLGVFEAWVIVAIALSTTSLSIVVTILKDSRLLETVLGRFVMAVAIFGELGPILAMALLISRKNAVEVRLFLILIFVAVVIAVALALARGVAMPRFLSFLERTLTQTSQLPVRLSVFLLVALAVLAEEFGLDLALGALAAGMVVRLATRQSPNPLLNHKLEGIGFGFLVPVFFVTSGMKLDIMAVIRTADGVFGLGTFFVALLIAHLPVVFVARRAASRAESVVAGLYGATTLSLIVAMTDVAVATGGMKPREATSMVVAGVVSVLLLPLAAARLQARDGVPPRPHSVEGSGGL